MKPIPISHTRKNRYSLNLNLVVIYRVNDFHPPLAHSQKPFQFEFESSRYLSREQIPLPFGIHKRPLLFEFESGRVNALYYLGTVY